MASTHFTAGGGPACARPWRKEAAAAHVTADPELVDCRRAGCKRARARYDRQLALASTTTGMHGNDNEGAAFVYPIAGLAVIESSIGLGLRLEIRSEAEAERVFAQAQSLLSAVRDVLAIRDARQSLDKAGYGRRYRDELAAAGGA